MEQRNIIEWSEHSEYRELTIPSGEIWMSESELVDLFNHPNTLQRGTGETLRGRADYQTKPKPVSHRI